MRRSIHALLLGVCALLLSLSIATTAEQRQQGKTTQPRIDVVFCLDTTGSMSGLINAAKQKIWSISNQIAGGKPTPILRIGLVAYRDRGDAYVTKRFDLTDDLDAVYENLMKLRAQGGGDFPESVNQALFEAVEKMNWSRGDKTLRIVFLVGDAPPKHYADDTPYQKTCETAVKRGIIINTIQCNNNPQTKKVWEDVAQRSEGRYIQLNASGGPVVVVKTPFDRELADLNSKLVGTTVLYGDARARRMAEAKGKAARSLGAPGAAERAGYAAKTGRVATYDLLDALKCGKVKLEKLKDSELPKELRAKSLKEKQAYLKKLEKQRAELLKRAAELDRKRSAYIAAELKKQAGSVEDSFDQRVLATIRSQARRIGVDYTSPGSKKEK